jgi:hypothetical protein
MGDEILLFHEEKQEYFRLNQTGAVIWRLFSSPQTVHGVVARLQSEFAVDESQCVDEVSQFVTDLVTHSFLVPV